MKRVQLISITSLGANSKPFISLDDPTIRLLANDDPALFFKRYKPPMIIDEIQYAPNLLHYIKIIIDKTNSPGLFWLTGSQHFHMMKNISESLAGRVAILNLLGLSISEIKNNGLNQKPFLPVFEIKNLENSDLQEIYFNI
jgi:predicted AAA+ superfamily ATPase